MFRTRLGDWGRRWRLLLIGASAGFLVVAAWYLVSLPPLLARVLLLDRTPAGRAIIGVDVGGFLLMAMLCAAEVAPAQGSGEVTGRTPRLQREFLRRKAPEPQCAASWPSGSTSGRAGNSSSPFPGSG